MKPKRKHVHRTIRKLMTTGAADNCSLCRRPFRHRDKTVGGLTRDGTIVLVGTCCAAQVSERAICTVGVYLTSGTVPLLSVWGTA
jgi:hypothetical protein